MSGFVASPPAQIPDTIIVGDGWWPSLSIAAFRDTMKIPRAVTDVRAREAIAAGMMDVAHQLRSWRGDKEITGATSLQEVESPSYGGEKEAVMLWRRAVFAFAAAELADTHSDISATDAGRDRTAARAVSADEHRRNATQAIRAMKGRGRNRVALK
jgi:Phage head completion protein (GPL)